MVEPATNWSSVVTAVSARSVSTAWTCLRIAATTVAGGSVERTRNVSGFWSCCVIGTNVSGSTGCSRPSCFSSPTTPMIVIQSVRSLGRPNLRRRPTGILTAEVAHGEGLIDNGDFRLVAAIGVVDDAAGQERHAGGAEIAGRDRLVPQFALEIAGPSSLDGAIAGPVGAAQRQAADRTDRFDARFSGNPLFDGGERLIPLYGCVVARGRQRNRRGDSVGSGETRVHAVEMRQAANQQQRQDDEHDRQCDLAGNQRVAKEARRSRAGSRSLSQASVRRRHQRGHDAEGDRRQQRQRRRHQDNAPIERDFSKQRYRVRRIHYEQLLRRDGDAETEHAAGDRHDQRLREQLTDETTPLRAERAPDGQLPGSPEPASELQVGGVHADQDEQQSDRAAEQPQRRPRLEGQAVVKAFEPDAHLRVGVRIETLEIFGDGVHVLLRLRERDARREACHHAQPVRSPRIDEDRRRIRDRQPDLDVAHRKEEIGGHDADDVVGARAERDGLADNQRVSAERTPPEAVTENRDTRLAFERLVVGERAPDERRSAQHGEQIAGHAQRFERLRLAGAGEEDIARTAAVAVQLLVGGEVGEHGVPRPPVCVVGRRCDVPGPAAERIGFEHPDDARGIPEGQRTEEHRAGEAEHRRAGADPDRQRGDRDNREHGVPGEGPDGIAEVLHRGVDERNTAMIAVMLLDLFGAAEAQCRRAPGLGRRHAATQVLADQKIEMRRHLAVEVVVETARSEQRTETKRQLREPGRHGPTRAPAGAAGR